MIAQLGSLLALFAAAAPAGSATTVPSVSLNLSGCDGVDEQVLGFVIKLELRVKLVAQSKADGGHIAIVCGAQGPTVAFTDLVTAKVLQRQVDLAAIAQRARTRMLALAAVELVTASWAELELDTHEDVRRAESRAPALEPLRAAARTTVSARRREPVRLWLLGVGQARLHVPANALLWGGGGRLHVHLPSTRWGLMTDLLLGEGRSSGPLVDATFQTTSIGAAVTLRTLGQRWCGVVATGVKGGLVRMRGQPRDGVRFEGREGIGGWFGPAFSAAVVVNVTRNFIMGVALEAGHAPIAPRGHVPEEAAYSLRGSWGAAQFSLGSVL